MSPLTITFSLKYAGLVVPHFTPKTTNTRVICFPKTDETLPPQREVFQRKQTAKMFHVKHLRRSFV